MQACGERGSGDGATPARDSGVPACLHRHFPPQSPPACPLGPAPHSQQQTSPWDCPTVAVPSGKHASLSGVLVAATRILCVILISFGLSQISCFAPSLSCFSSGCGNRTPASVPPLAEGRSSPTSSPFFPPTSFILLSFAWPYKFFSGGQVLLSALSFLCSASPSVSEGVFLMYPWRERYSTSTYFPAILFKVQMKSSKGNSLGKIYVHF